MGRFYSSESVSGSNSVQSEAHVGVSGEISALREDSSSKGEPNADIILRDGSIQFMQKRRCERVSVIVERDSWIRNSRS